MIFHVLLWINLHDRGVQNQNLSALRSGFVGTFCNPPMVTDQHPTHDARKLTGNGRFAKVFHL